jgi:outer membrane receptor protein involved in Fe transport
LSRRYNLPNARPDVADNSVPAVVYVSLSARYALPVGNRGTMEFFANAENLLDQDPPLTPGVFDASLAQTGSQVSSYYDLLGRRFTVGLKFRH